MSSELAEEIKSRLDIVEFIGEHLPLKRAGQNFKGLCPFHSEKSPSFMVNPARQIFHCFGCNRGGDIVTFVMHYENLPFPEALRLLADRAGVTMRTEHTGLDASRSQKELLHALHTEAVAFYRDNLKKSWPALSYLRGRGIQDETMEHFSLGYARNESDSIYQYLHRRGASVETLKASGLVGTSDRGTYDFFRNRIIFPILDLQGRVIAFGGRIMSPTTNAPKYLNSPDSPIFHKGESLYGLSAARQAIVQKGYTTMVEGYLDVINCVQNGFTNAVAPLGTALTPGQLRKLKRFSDKLLLVFDGDAAGISATKRSLEITYQESMTAKVLILPEGEDPDSLLRKRGAEEFRKHLRSATTPPAFVMRVFEKNRLDGVRFMLRLLSVCPDALLREDGVRDLAEQAKISEQLLHEELKTMRSRGTRRNRTEKQLGTAQPDHHSSPPAAIRAEEEMLLAVTLLVPQYAPAIVTTVRPDDIDSTVVKGLFVRIGSLITASGGCEHLVEELLRICTPQEQAVVTRLLMGKPVTAGVVDESVKDCLRRVALHGLEQRIVEADQQGDEQRLQSLLGEKKRLISGQIVHNRGDIRED